MCNALSRVRPLEKRRLILSNNQVLTADKLLVKLSPASVNSADWRLGVDHVRGKTLLTVGSL